MVLSRWLAPSPHRLAVTLAILGAAILTTAPVAAQALTISGSPATLRVAAAVAGSPPTPATDAVTTYTTRTTAGNTKQITAQLDGNMPAGTTLTINLAATTGATSTGTLTLTTTAQSGVTNINNLGNKTAAITYTFSATAAAGVIASATRIVTFTLVAFP